MSVFKQLFTFFKAHCSIVHAVAFQKTKLIFFFSAIIRVTRSLGGNRPTFESSQNIGRAKNATISPINPLLKPEDTYNKAMFWNCLFRWECKNFIKQINVAILGLLSELPVVAELNKSPNLVTLAIISFQNST